MPGIEHLSPRSQTLNTGHPVAGLWTLVIQKQVSLQTSHQTCIWANVKYLLTYVSSMITVWSQNILQEIYVSNYICKYSGKKYEGNSQWNQFIDNKLIMKTGLHICWAFEQYNSVLTYHSNETATHISYKSFNICNYLSKNITDQHKKLY
jgi:hypothetical protein